LNGKHDHREWLISIAGADDAKVAAWPYRQGRNEVLLKPIELLALDPSSVNHSGMSLGPFGATTLAWSRGLRASLQFYRL